VAHDLNMALACAHRTALLNCGRIVAFGPTAEILDAETIETVFRVKARLFTDEMSGQRHAVMLSAANLNKTEY
jgi:ABC-type cobalamin/Fe3+-siderophores transport system ATPase subunit